MVPELVQNFSMRGRQGDPSQFRRAQPAAGNLCGWITGNENSRLYQVSSEGVTNPYRGQTPGRTEQSGKKMESQPAASRVLLGQPDFSAPPGKEDVFALDSRGMFAAGGRGKLRSSRAGFASGTNGAARVFRQTDQGP